MSTAGRLNKSTTKFVPKRKAGSSSQGRASSATPSIAGTPRVAANSLGLNAIDDFSLGEPLEAWKGTRPGAIAEEDEEASTSTTGGDKAIGSAITLGEPIHLGKGHQSRVEEDDDVFVAPVPTISKTAPSPRVAPPTAFPPSRQTRKASPISVGTSFGPSDPTPEASTSSQSHLQRSPSAITPIEPPSPSLGTSFSPSQSAPTSFNNASTQATSFGASLSAPSPRLTASSIVPRDPTPGPSTSTKSTVNVAAISAAQSAPSRSTVKKPAASKEPPAPVEKGPAIEKGAGKKKETKAKKAKAPPKGKVSTKSKKAETVSKAKGKGKRKEVASDLVEEAEDEQDATADSIEQDLDPDVDADRIAEKKAKDTSKKKERKGSKKAAISKDVVEETEGGDSEPVVAKSIRPKRKRAAKSKAPIIIDNDEEEDTMDEDEDEEVEPPAKKQKSAKAKGKEKVVEPDPTSEIATSPRRRKRTLNARASDADEDAASEELPDALSDLGEGNESDDSHESFDSNGQLKERMEKSRKKKAKKEKERPLPTVDPTVTLMADLATSRDSLGGRMSERGIQLEQKAQQKKLARKLARQKMKDRAKRRNNGEEVSSDEEDAPFDPDTSLLDRLDPRKGSATPSNIGRAGSPAILAALNSNIAPGPSSPPPPTSDDENAGDNGAEGDEGEAGEGSDDEGFEGLVETQYAPQMRIVDGQLVIDDSSLQIDRSAQAEAAHSGPREIIEESARDRMVNSGTWGKRQRVEKWTNDETERFYDYLRQFGTDFEMIARLFTNRTRRQIKAKWNREDRLHPAAITAALMRKKTIDLDSYSQITGHDLSGPVPEDPYEKIQKIREETEALEKVNIGSSVKKQQTAIPEEGEEEEGPVENNEEDDEEEAERLREEEERQAEVEAEIAAAAIAEKAQAKKKRR